MSSRARPYILIAFGVVATMVFIGAALDGDKLPSFSPTGVARPVPASGEIVSSSLAEFEGMLVGQRGRPVVVNLWASWCAPCRTEMPLLQEASRAYGDRILILGVATKDEVTAAQHFVDEVGITYPNIFDPSGEIRVALSLNAYPTTYVFRADGKLSARVTGGVSEQRLGALIEDALR